jgi:hypothetical protein
MQKILVSTASVAVFASLLLAGENLRSGPQVGEKVPGPFEPLNLTGSSAGQKACLYCRNGNNPVVMIFAREPNDAVVSLIKKVDAATARHKDQKMGSFVVFLNDDESAGDKIKGLAKKEGIETTVLSLDKAEGPSAYKVSKEADVTVVLYSKREVKANYAFGNGELADKDIETVISDVSKILPKE